MTSDSRATVETEAPGANDAATISRFNASGQGLLVRRPPFVPMIAFVDTFTSRATSDQPRNPRGCVKGTMRSSVEGYGYTRADTEQTLVGDAESVTDNVR